MSLSVKGKISSKLSVENGTSKVGKEWKKQSFLVDTGAQYNPEICFQLFGEDKIACAIENAEEAGDPVAHQRLTQHLDDRYSASHAGFVI